MGSGTRFSIGSLSPGDGAEIRFTLMVDAQAQTGVYNIPFKISGMNYSSSDYIGVGVAGITDFEFMSVMERTKQIGLLKAIGAGEREIMKLFLIESGIFGLVGGIIGVVFGAAISLLIMQQR